MHKLIFNEKYPMTSRMFFVILIFSLLTFVGTLFREFGSWTFLLSFLPVCAVIEHFIYKKKHCIEEDIKGKTLISSTINDKDEQGYTKLHNASLSGQAKEIQSLINAGANVNEIDRKFNMTALHWAANLKNKECVQILLKANADINILSKSNKTPVMVAVSSDHLSIVEILLKAGADVNKHGGPEKQTAILMAVRNNNIDMVRLLLSYGADPSISFFGELPEEATTDEEIKYLLRNYQTVRSDFEKKILVESGNQATLNQSTRSRL